MQDWDP